MQPPIDRVDRGAVLSDLVRARLPGHDPAAVLLMLYVTRLGRLMELFQLQAEVDAPKLDPACQAVLAMLFIFQPTALSPTELSRSVIQTSGGMTKTLRRLEAESLIARSPDHRDGRSVQITLTPRGRTRIRRYLKDLATRWERSLELDADIEPTEATTMADSLVAMLELATEVGNYGPSQSE
jgi:DNA-binding MarR family transcriptional regulator